MKHMSTPLRLSLCRRHRGRAAVRRRRRRRRRPANLTTATTTATAAKKPPTTATPEMVNEAIQRSRRAPPRPSRAARTEQWGSEEPFAYNPAMKRFSADQQ